MNIIWDCKIVGEVKDVPKIKEMEGVIKERR